MTYIFKRLLKLIPILLGVTILTFTLLYFAPSDPAKMHYHNMGVSYTDEMLENYRKEKGLNKPFIIQYKNWLFNVIEGDLGQSYNDGSPVIQKISQAIPYTLSLGINSVILTLIFSLPAGFYLALYPKKKKSKFLLFLSFLGNSIPNFILGLGLMYLLAMKLGWFPILANNSAKGIVLPILALSIAMISKYIRQIATITSNELKQDHIKGLRARGVPLHKILFGTVLKNTAIPIVTLVGMSMGSLLGGTAVVETMFNWPGLGKMIVDSVGNRDYPLVQGIVLWMTLAFVLINIFTDLSYVLFDPRVRLGGERDE